MATDEGDAPKLKREMSGLGGLMITLSCLSPSIGVYVAASDVIRQSGTWVFMALVLAVLLGIAMSAVYAELGSAFPHAGGDYTMIGKTLGPTAGFAILSVMLLVMPVALSLSSLGMTDYLRAVAPGLPSVPTAILAVALVTVIAALSVRVNAWITGLFMGVEVLALAVTAWLGLAHPHRSLAAAVLHPVMAAPGGGLQAVPLVMMGVSAAGAVYIFNGYGSAVQLGEEMVGARQKMGRVVFGALGLAALTILPPILGVLVGTRDLGRLLHSASPVSDFIREAGGPNLAAAVSLGVALAIFNAMIATALIGARLLYAAARDQAWPAPISRVLAIVHPRFGSPWPATLAVGGVALFLCLIPIKTLIMINGNAAVADYILMALAAIAGRRNGATAASQARMWAYPAAPVAALLALGLVVWADFLDRDAGRTGLIVTGLVLALGALFYRLSLRRGRAWAHRDPEEEPAMP